MQPKIEQMVKDAIQPHLQPLLDKQVIIEETVSQLQNNNDHIRKLNNRITRDLVNNDFVE
jgi:hypothetical protein